MLLASAAAAAAERGKKTNTPSSARTSRQFERRYRCGVSISFSRAKKPRKSSLARSLCILACCATPGRALKVAATTSSSAQVDDEITCCATTIRRRAARRCCRRPDAHHTLLLLLLLAAGNNALASAIHCCGQVSGSREAVLVCVFFRRFQIRRRRRRGATTRRVAGKVCRLLLRLLRLARVDVKLDARTRALLTQTRNTTAACLPFRTAAGGNSATLKSRRLVVSLQPQTITRASERASE